MEYRRRGTRFTLDFNFLDILYPNDTKFIIRSGDGKPNILGTEDIRILRERHNIGAGDRCDTVTLNADRGYLLWVNPSGSVQVKFKYGRTGDDFKCFIDPEHSGVKVYEVRPYNKELIIDGKEPLDQNTNPHHVKKSAVRPRENNFVFQSKKGELVLQLETLRDRNVSFPLAFKMNYVLTL